MFKLEFPDCINDDARTLDEYIFDYFNTAYPDEVAAVIEEWKKRFQEPLVPKGES